jgi:hypothetical protein
MPDERCRILCRRLARREQLMRARTRAKNEIHAVLQRRLQERPPCSDLFGVKGLHWLAWIGGLEKPKRKSCLALARQPRGRRQGAATNRPRDVPAAFGSSRRSRSRPRLGFDRACVGGRLRSCSAAKGATQKQLTLRLGDQPRRHDAAGLDETRESGPRSS